LTAHRDRQTKTDRITDINIVITAVNDVAARLAYIAALQEEKKKSKSKKTSKSRGGKTNKQANEAKQNKDKEKCLLFF
jgi:hypothetical protein